MSEDHTLETRVSYTLEMDSRFFIVENVPARVGEETREPFFSPETVERLQETIRSLEAPERMIEIPVYVYLNDPSHEER